MKVRLLLLRARSAKSEARSSKIDSISFSHQFIIFSTFFRREIIFCKYSRLASPIIIIFRARLHGERTKYFWENIIVFKSLTSYVFGVLLVMTCFWLAILYQTLRKTCKMSLFRQVMISMPQNTEFILPDDDILPKMFCFAVSFFYHYHFDFFLWSVTFNP